MKTLLLIFTLLFSTVVFSSPSFAGWTWVGENVNGDTYYVDYERIRKHDGFVYYWTLENLLKPLEQGLLSSREYNQGDCQIFRIKLLDASYHTQPMGEGTPSLTGVTKGQMWRYPAPNSSNELILKLVCSR